MRKKIDLVNQTDVAVQAATAPDHTVAGAGDDVLEAIHAVMRLARALQHRAMRAQDSELSPMEGKVLGFFARHAGATLSDLATHSGRDKGQLARLVGGLRDRGLLQAVVDEHDRRVTRLHLAGPAQAQHETLMQLRRHLSQQAASGLSTQEHKQLLKLLAKIQDAMTAASAEGRGGCGS